MSDEPKVIWLAPACYSHDPEGRQWCEDNVWDDECECDEIKHRAVRYVIAPVSKD